GATHVTGEEPGESLAAPCLRRPAAKPRRGRSGTRRSPLQVLCRLVKATAAEPFQPRRGSWIETNPHAALIRLGSGHLPALEGRHVQRLAARRPLPGLAAGFALALPAPCLRPHEVA